MNKLLKKRSVDTANRVIETINSALEAESRGDWMVYSRLINRACRLSVHADEANVAACASRSGNDTVKEAAELASFIDDTFSRVV
jgi:hypothetical protein